MRWATVSLSKLYCVELVQLICCVLTRLCVNLVISTSHDSNVGGRREMAKWATL